MPFGSDRAVDALMREMEALAEAGERDRDVVPERAQDGRDASPDPTPRQAPGMRVSGLRT
jgi:hypothetical protein